MGRERFNSVAGGHPLRGGTRGLLTSLRVSSPPQRQDGSRRTGSGSRPFDQALLLTESGSRPSTARTPRRTGVRGRGRTPQGVGPRDETPTLRKRSVGSQGRSVHVGGCSGLPFEAKTEGGTGGREGWT